MMGEVVQILRGWSAIDTWIVATGALAAMACSIPGCFLLLKRQSMMGDALSHTSLLGVVAAFVGAQLLVSAGYISPSTLGAVKHAILFSGAVAIGLLTALLTEWIARRGRVEPSAALGVVFSVMFALGLLLMRMFADQAHIDPDCVLYGTVELSYMGAGVPEAAIVNAGMLAVNLLLAALFFKELRISAFDPALATALGIPAQALHYALMAVTAVTLVAAFESVGAILVIAMLITPAATAHLLTDRLGKMMALALLLAAASALLGHVLAITLPAIVFRRLGYAEVTDASSAGMMAVAAGLLFGLALLFGPRYGLLSRAAVQAAVRLRIAAEDFLGALYRQEERAEQAAARTPSGVPMGQRWLAAWMLRWRGLIAATEGGYRLTEHGRRTAQGLVRGHRLWESYLAQHFPLPPDQLHESAKRAEHFIGAAQREELASELAESGCVDPHGRAIPEETQQAQSGQRTA